MERMVTLPENEEQWLFLKSRDITSTEVSALFGCCPYMTRFELWHTKKAGNIVRLDDNERMKWGRRNESTIAEGLAEDFNLKIRKIKKYVSIPELRIGASYDYGIVDENNRVKESLEVKNVDYFQFKEEWFKKGDHIEAPLHIEFQLQHQMLLAGVPNGRFGVLVGGNTSYLINREASKKAQDTILAKCAEFWKSVDDGIEPEPDFIRDAEFLMKLFSQDFTPTKIDVNEDEKMKAAVKQFLVLRDAQSFLGKRKDAWAAKIVGMMGPAEKATGALDGVPFTVTASMNKKGDKRNFRID